MNINIAEEMIRDRERLPVGFDFFRWECFPSVGETLYVEISGAVACKYTRGHKRGKTNWRTMDRPTRRTFVVPVKDYESYEKDWVVRTGKCPRCTGTGKTVTRIDFVAGVTTYKHCHDCGGTGNARGEGARVKISEDAKTLFGATP